MEIVSVMPFNVENRSLTVPRGRSCGLDTGAEANPVSQRGDIETGANPLSVP